MAGLGIAMAFYSSRKAGEELDNDHGINRLPDDILCNIVSRLMLIERSRTSILSRRWRNIWTMNPRLGFYCLDMLGISDSHHNHVDYGHRQRFLKAVNQCLRLYSGHQLKVFCMHCCFLKSHASLVERWIQTIASLDVEDIYLYNICSRAYGEQIQKAFTFSFKLINGASRLRNLDLVLFNVETDFVGQCSSLVRLSLGVMPLQGHELSDILVSCPNLGTLSLQLCALPLNLRIAGPNLKLETLEFRDCSHVQKLDISDCNLVTIMIIIITEVEVSLSSVPKLERLHLQTPKMHYSFGDVPRDLPRLKFLSIQAANQMLWLPPSYQVFGKVRILYLLTKGDNEGKAFKEVDLWNFAPVLGACPLLEEFYLTVGGPFRKGEREVKWPAMVHKRLEYVELSGFSNTHVELEFAKFILTSAEVLQLLLLRSSIRRYNGTWSFSQGEEDLVRSSIRKYNGRPSFFEGEQDSIPEDAQVVCENLRGHALSMRAKVEMC